MGVDLPAVSPVGDCSILAQGCSVHSQLCYVGSGMDTCVQTRQWVGWHPGLTDTWAPTSLFPTPENPRPITQAAYLPSNGRPHLHTSPQTSEAPKNTDLARKLVTAAFLALQTDPRTPGPR